MKAKVVAYALPALILTSIHLTQAQQLKKVPRVGFLSTGVVESNIAAFQQGLRELGYIEGQNIFIEYRYAKGNYDQLPDLATELLRLNLDVIFAPSTPAALAAKNATQTVQSFSRQFPIRLLMDSFPVWRDLALTLRDRPKCLPI